MRDTDDLVIRPATGNDLPALGRLGAMLVEQHYRFDRMRFMAPGSDPEKGYAWFLGTQLEEPDTLVAVAERHGTVIGYVYAAVEPRSWKELREEAGFIHDVVVDPGARRSGVATALIEAVVRWFAERGVPRVVLWTAQPNEAAQALFARLGFRRTMIEMTREIGGAGKTG